MSDLSEDDIRHLAAALADELERRPQRLHHEDIDLIADAVAEKLGRGGKPDEVVVQLGVGQLGKQYPGMSRRPELRPELQRGPGMGIDPFGKT
jgi:hypothetical protein